MDVRLSAEQRALRDAAAQLVDRLGPTSVADLGDAGRRDKLESALAASGWRELRAAGDGGEPLATAVETAIVAEEFGRGLVDVPFLGPTLATDLRRLATAEAPTAAETVAVTADLMQLACVDGAGPVTAVAVDAADAVAALHLLVDPSGLRLVSSPVREGATGGVDLTRDWRCLELSGGSVTASGEQAPVSDEALGRFTALGLALACADLVGTMRGTIDLARGYAGTRQQYGATIGSFQAVQHLLADAFVAMEGSRSVALHAAWAVDRLTAGEALVAAATAKAYCARAARSVCEASIQVHGGIGNTWECLAHVFLRRALGASDLLGNVGPSLDRVLRHRMGSIDGLR